MIASYPGITPEASWNAKRLRMQKYSVDLMKKKMENEFGFKLFFDFKIDKYAITVRMG
jgi:hypothetical protein